MRISIAQVKVYPDKGDLEANYARLMSVLDEIETYASATGDGPDVVITPECFLDGYVSTEAHVTRENIVSYGIDPSSSPHVRHVSDWAREHSAWFVLGCTRLRPQGASNTALILDRSGQLVGMYDKTHCQTHDQKYVPGSSLPVFQSDFGPFGVLICADRRWPETVRTLALRGARIVFNPTYGMHDERNLHMMQTRSYESEIWIAFTHPGQSLLTGPRGEIVTNETSADRRFVLSTADLAEVDLVRVGKSAHLRDRRPELYLS